MEKMAVEAPRQTENRYDKDNMCRSKWVSYAMREILDHGIQMRLEGILCFLYTLL